MTRGVSTRRFLALLLVVAVLGACRVRTEVAIDVHDDGAGTVSVAIGVDDDGLKRFPGIADQLRTDDLRAAGWTVDEPKKEGDGFTWFRARKPFATPGEAGRILDEVAGDDGPFRDFEVTRSESFARTKFTFSGSVDFSGGLEAFGDAGLAEQLDGAPLGQPIDAIEAQLGEAVDRVFRFRVLVRLPGKVSSNARTGATNGAIWEPRLSEAGPVALRASSTSWRTGTLLWSGVAAIAAVAALTVLVVEVRRRRRRTRAAA